jgi:hypothetical protein
MNPPRPNYAARRRAEKARVLAEVAARHLVWQREEEERLAKLRAKRAQGLEPASTEDRLLSALTALEAQEAPPPS